MSDVDFATLRLFALQGPWQGARMEALGDSVAEEYCDDHGLWRFPPPGSGDGSGFGDADWA